MPTDSPQQIIEVTETKQSNCDCYNDGFCQRYNREMVGRLREICAGVNIAPEDAEQYRQSWKRMANRRKLILRCHLSPGDVLTLTAAIESLHASYPLQYLTDVRTSCNDVFIGNPRISPLNESDTEVQIIECHYPSVHRSNQHNTQFLAGYTENLGTTLKKPLDLRVNKPQVYLLEQEKRKRFIDGPYWIVNAGTKHDYTNKQWPVEYYQQVVDETKDVIQWVQMGERHQRHVKLTGVVDTIDKNLRFRELMILTHHSSGGLGPVTALMHLCAAFDKPYICLNGGREPVTWIQYPKQQTLHTIGQLPCCENSACWKSRTVPLPDKETKLNESLCEYPIQHWSDDTPLLMASPRCMTMIEPSDVVSLLRKYISDVG